jgi:hypothetical protein
MIDMTVSELKDFLLHWRGNRLSKLAPEMIAEFQSSPECWDALHQIAIHVDEYPFQEYASWLCGHLISEIYRNPQKIEEIIDAWLITENHSVRRNLLKIMLAVPSYYKNGEVLDRLLRYLASPDEAIAVRSYAFSMLMKIMKAHPDLHFEIDAIIKSYPELFKVPALQSCMKKYKMLLAQT